MGPRAADRRARATRASTRFADLLTIKQVAAELERGTPLRVDPARAARRAAGTAAARLRHPATPRPTRRAPKVVSLERAQADPGRRGARAARRPAPIPFPLGDPQAALAAKYFVEGSRLDDGDERKMEAAAAAYRKALVIDPELVPAIVNLANIHYACDELIEAQALYERAIGLDPDCFEAHFNLGNIQHDLGRLRRRAGVLSRCRRAQSRLPRRALLSGGHAGKDGAFAGSQAALEGVPGARARTASGWSWRRNFWSSRSG